VLAAACTREVVKEVPVEVVVEKEIVKEVPVEKIVIMEKEVIKEVPVIKEVVVVKEVEVIKEVPVIKIVTEEKVVVREIEKIVIATAVPVGQEKFLMRTLYSFPKQGGQLVLGAHGPSSHFDIFAGASIANIGSQGPMYDQLIRRDPRDPAMPIVPDLAYRWDISSDALTYTFFLREGVKFHDGPELTSEDVKATYERILFPASDLVSVRLPMFYDVVSEINTPDRYTVEFKLSEARSPALMLESFVVQWNSIVQKKTLDEHGGNLRKVDNFPGTGPFTYVSRSTDTWLQERNPNYWNPNVPYVDSIKHVWLRARSTAGDAAFLGGLVDWWMWLTPKTASIVRDRAGMTLLEQKSIGVLDIAFMTQRSPLSDKRVRRAFGLVIDSRALVQATAHIRKFIYGEFFVGGTPFSLHMDAILETPVLRPPTKEDIAEAKRLLADAGYPDGKGMKTLDLMPTGSPNTHEITTARAPISALSAPRTRISSEMESPRRSDSPMSPLETPFIQRPYCTSTDPSKPSSCMRRARCSGVISCKSSSP